jgi:molybdopterin-containing oxidoreductase family iron-sulfur binding subunit
MRVGFVIDLERCIGCRSCAVACRQHNAQAPGTWWARVVTPGSDEHLVPPAAGSGYFLPVTCQHCENAPCEKVCPVGATYRAEDGAVLIDFERCIGCRYCMAACPYGVRQFNWQDPTEAHARAGLERDYSYGYPEDHRHEGRLVYTPLRPRGVVEKCTLCSQYRDDGLDPACVRGCPGRARYVGDLDDPASEVSRLVRTQRASTLLPEAGTRPSCYYLPPRRPEECEP